MKYKFAQNFAVTTTIFKCASVAFAGHANDDAMSDPAGRRKTGAAAKAAAKAGAYGGSEVGAMVGHMAGPPVIGGIVGNVIGERVGEKAVHASGMDRVAGEISEGVARVVGERRADKMGEIAMTALGYSEAEHCICCPCMPKSQLLFFVMTG